MLTLIPNLRVRERIVSTEIQCMILGAHLQKITKGEIISWTHDWLRCTLKEAKKIVESTLVACIKEGIKL